MKTLLWISISALLFVSSSIGYAKAKSDQDWAEAAALNYDRQATAAAEKGDAESARIYSRMAQIKRDSGAAASKGDGFDWTEYHELAGKLDAHQHQKKVKQEKSKAPDKGKDVGKDVEKKKAKEDLNEKGKKYGHEPEKGEGHPKGKKDEAAKASAKKVN